MGTEPSQPVRNYLVPTVQKAPDGELEEVFKKYKITKAQLPHIKLTDAGIAGIGVGPGDVVKIERKSWQTGETTQYYRLVVE